MRDLITNVGDIFERFPLVEAAVIIVAFAILARLVDWALSGSIRQATRKSHTEFDDRLIEILHRPVFATVSLIGVLIATYRLGLDPDPERVTVTIIQSLLVLIWIWFGLRFTRLLLETMSQREDRFELVQTTTEPLLANALAVVLFLVGIYSILIIWDINITGLIASAGIIGLALSFAAQDTLSNLFAGVAILSDRPYQIGDFIILDTGERGRVTRIGLRSTRLVTLDDVEISIPNGVMGATKIINEAGGPQDQYRIRTTVGVSYGSDVEKVVDVLYGVARDHPMTLEHPEPIVWFTQFGDSSLDFQVLAWIQRPAHRDPVVHELNMEILKRFRENGITIPFPQRDLHVKEWPTRDDQEA